MKKQLFSLFCTLVLLCGIVPSAAALTGDALRSADVLSTVGLVDGDGAAVGYHLDAPATRAQAALLLVRLSGSEQASKNAGSAGFRDTPAWAADAIHYAAGEGWVSGFSATEFRPNSPVTANAWCAMLLRMLGYSDAEGDYTIHDAPDFAQRIGLVSRRYDGVMTRGDVFQTMREALRFSYKDRSETVIQRLIANGVCTRAAANAMGLLDRELTAREVADQHMAAVFCLDVYASQKDVDEENPTSNASGFFITTDGLAVTNYHSIAGGVYAEATLCTGESYAVERVVYYDADIDIAVIRIAKTSSDNKTTSAFAALELAGTQELRVGDVAYTISNPLGLGLAVSSGVISDAARTVDRYTLPCVMSTADISQGSSGGVLLNVYGQAVAVTAGAYTYGNSMYLAVPVDPVMTADLTGPGKTMAEVASLEADKS